MKISGNVMQPSSRVDGKLVEAQGRVVLESGESGLCFFCLRRTVSDITFFFVNGRIFGEYGCEDGEWISALMFANILLSGKDLLQAFFNAICVSAYYAAYRATRMYIVAIINRGPEGIGVG